MKLRKLLKVIPRAEKVLLIRMTGDIGTSDENILVSDYERQVRYVFSSMNSDNEPMLVVEIGD